MLGFFIIRKVLNFDNTLVVNFEYEGFPFSFSFLSLFLLDYMSLCCVSVVVGGGKKKILNFRSGVKSMQIGDRVIDPYGLSRFS
jgi:hypothetical protein